MNGTREVGWFGIAWWIWGLLSLALAAIWLYVWPSDAAADAQPLQYWFLRWGHAATWFALAANFFVRQWLPNGATLANVLALVGLGFYIGFLSATLLP